MNLKYREKITTYPVFNMDGYRYITQVEAAIKLYGRETDVLVEIIPLSLQEYDSVRKQYKADMVIGRIASRRDVDKKEKVLGLTGVDLYMPNMNFVFGVTNTNSKAAILSLARLTPLPSGIHFGSFKTVEERIFKESAHEIGHLIGLTHCFEPTCIMSYANSIKEVDDKLPLICNACREKLKGKQ
jgi:archaemetzincin